MKPWHDPARVSICHQMYPGMRLFTLDDGSFEIDHDDTSWPDTLPTRAPAWW